MKTEWHVSAHESGVKLIAFLKTKVPPQIASRQLKRAIEAGQCSLNGKVERFASVLVGTGDRIFFNLIEEVKTKQTPIKDNILYIDDDLLAYNKPSGVISESPELLKSLSVLFPSVRDRAESAAVISAQPLILLHRLDRGTTGVLLFARNAQVAQAMLDLFKQRKVTKTYLALVDGVPKQSNGIIENFLGKLNIYEGQTLWGAVSREKGQVARTTWKLKKAGRDASLILCLPETGRTHQIRVHLSGLGHPILGDNQYGRSFRCQHHAARVMLHAVAISFNHPITGQLLTIKAPIPKDFIDSTHTILQEAYNEKDLYY